MDYRRIYNQLVMKAWRREGVDGYKERHHIIPRCQGGGNGKANLVDLTAAEHYIAHLLLMKMYPANYKLAHPIILMGRNLGKGTKNKLYDKARIVVSEGLKGKKLSEETKAKIGKAGIGRFVSEETRMKRSTIFKGRKFSEEHKGKLAKAKLGKSPSNKGVKHSEETRAKMRESWKSREVRNPTKGIVHTEEARVNMSAAHKGKKLSPESITKRTTTRAKNKQRRELLQFWCVL